MRIVFYAHTSVFWSVVLHWLYTDDPHCTLPAEYCIHELPGGKGKKITTSDLSFPLFYIPLSWQSKGDSCWKCTSKESATLESCSASLQVSRMNKITGHPTQLFELPLYLPSLEWFIITYDVINNGLYIYYEDVSALGYITHCDGEKDFICGFAPSRLAF